jgi:hypothetical protein
MARGIPTASHRQGEGGWVDGRATVDGDSGMSEDDVINLRPSPEEEKAIIEELAKFKSLDPLVYARKKKEVAKRLGVTLEDIDRAVKALDSAEGESVADELVLIAAKRARLWHSADQLSYATITYEGHLEHYAVDDDRFQYWLSDEFGKLNLREINGELWPRYPDRSELAEATYQIKNHCLRKEQLSPRVRINYVEDVLWLDLGGKDWKGVHVSADGWRIVERIEAPLIRHRGMLELPEPERGGDIRELRQFVNVRPEDFVLFCGDAAGLFNTFGNYITTIFCGPAGSGKTTTARFMRGLIDPHKVDTRPFTSVRDLMHGAGNTHIVSLENISEIKAEFSDAICRLNTGLGYAERLYYNQGKEFMTSLHCPVLINGIPGNLAERDDLLDRTVTFAFGSRDGLISEDVIRRRYLRALPRMLGALLDGVVGALRVRREFDEDNDAAAAALLDGFRPRFVDFAVFAEAACRAMGFEEGEFAKAYRDNLGYALRYYAEHNPVCVGIRKLISAEGSWQGYPEQLWKAIRPYTSNLDQGLRNASWLAREDLPRAIPALAKVYGIKVVMGKRLEKDDNANGIVIEGVGRGTHFEEELSGSGGGEE